MVSDRMLYNRFNLWLGFSRHGSDLPGQTYPEELFDELSDAGRIPEELEQELFARFSPVGSGVLEENLHDPWYELFLVFARDEAYRTILQRVLERESYDFVAYYVNGPDVASHYFWKHRFPEEWPEPIPEDELRARGEVIARYYAYVDESIAPLLAQADERCLVIVLSDHGFVTGRRPDASTISGIHHDAAPPGVIAMAGGGLEPASKLDRGHVLDVAPTVLHALGLAVARDMDGLVWSASPALERPVRYVGSYDEPGKPTQDEPITTEYDEAIVEKLKALGYLAGD
jgi:arylsulfatase A-like enzyme